MTRLARCVALALSLAALPLVASAQQPNQPVTLDFVDGFVVWGNGFEVTGLAHGAESRALHKLGMSVEVRETCERMLLVMLERPGVYRFSYEPARSGQYTRCGLTRAE